MVLRKYTITGTAPLTRFFGTGKNRVKGKPRFSTKTQKRGIESPLSSKFLQVKTAITVIACIFLIKFCLFVCYDLRPDMFQSHELAVVITPPLGVFIQIVCVFGSQLLALSNA